MKAEDTINRIRGALADHLSGYEQKSENRVYIDIPPEVVIEAAQLMFEEIGALRPLKEAANILAEYDGWGKLYDPERLSKNTVPVACSVYFNDMMVNKQYSQETIDSVPNMKGWYTSEYEHCGLRVVLDGGGADAQALPARGRRAGRRP